MPLRSLTIGWILLGWILAATASSQPVTYSLGNPLDMLDAAYYAGEAIDGSNVAGRGILGPKPSPDGSRISFISRNRDTEGSGVFVVDVGDPSSWRRIFRDQGFDFDVSAVWTPDGSAVSWNGFLIDADDATTTTHLVHGTVMADSINMTRLQQDNWATSTMFPAGHVDLFPILPDGTEDLSRSPVRVVDITPPNSETFANEAIISPDGSALAFIWYVISLTGPGPDAGDLYVLTDLPAILAAPKIAGTDTSTLAPTTLADARITSIRSSETANFLHCPSWSQDSSLMLYCEDWNNVFRTLDFVATGVLGDWDVMVSNSNSSGDDFRIVEAGIQASPAVFPGGVRLVHSRSVGAPNEVHLFAVTFEVATSVTGIDIGNNDIVTTGVLTAGDGSGTQVQIPAGTTIDFPAGEPREVQITTPLDPVQVAQFPPGAAVDAIPVVRTFGPDGTSFSPPIVIEMSYTDAEIEGLVEILLRPYLFNETTMLFDIPILDEDIVERDLVNNTISFQVSSFSSYGLAGFSSQPFLGARGWQLFE